VPTFFSPEGAATRLQEIIAASGAQDHLRIVGIGLILLFCLLSLYRALLAGSGPAVVEAFLRAGIAGLLVQNSDLFAAAAVSFFRFMQVIGSQINARLGDWQTVAGVDQTLHELWAALWASWDRGLVSAIGNLGEHVMFGLLASLTTVLFVFFYVIVIAIYNFLVFTALMTLVLATLVAPLSFAFLAHRFTQPFVFEWLQVILHASLVILLAQAIVGIVVSLAVLQPLQDFVDMAKTGGTSLGVIKIPVAALVGLGVGIFALLNVQGLASAFVGRVESVAGATMAAFLGLRLAGSVLGSASEMIGGRLLSTPAGGGSGPSGHGPTPPAASRGSIAAGVPLPGSPTSAPPTRVASGSDRTQ
jgi:hypothetical protein